MNGIRRGITNNQLMDELKKINVHVKQIESLLITLQLGKQSDYSKLKDPLPDIHNWDI